MVSWPMLDLPVSLRVKVGAKVDEIMFDMFNGRTSKERRRVKVGRSLPFVGVRTKQA